MKNKKIIPWILIVLIIFLAAGTLAYFRKMVVGNLSAQSGNLSLVVNEANAVLNESFSVTLKNYNNDDFIIPDDEGTFNLNIDATGSSLGVSVNISFSRTNLPENLKFYFDSEYEREFSSTYSVVIPKSDDMTMTIPIYWFWDGSKDDENDSLFKNKDISAYIDVTATLSNTFYSLLFNKNPILDTNVDFTTLPSRANGMGLMMKEETQNDEYPVLYFRGAVTDNSVIFANYCWLVVRTTETGGVKLIYNGLVNDNGTCNNYSSIDTGTEYDVPKSGDDLRWSLYNSLTGSPSVSNDIDESTSPVYLGYMYDDRASYVSLSRTETETDIIINGVIDVDGYLGNLNNNNIDQATGRHIQNLKDSKLKIDNDFWYENNFLGTDFEDMLEDTVWCSDRTISDIYSVENYEFLITRSGTQSYHPLLFGSAVRNAKFLQLEYVDVELLVNKPSLVCERDIDKFTVDSANGNGDLNYPIGALTTDEVVLAGDYLDANMHVFSTMSPVSFIRNQANIGYDLGYGTGAGSTDSSAYRPSVSLKNSVKVVSGDGTYANPYIVG